MTRASIRTIAALLAGTAMTLASAAEPVAAQGKGGTGVTVVNGFLDESQLTTYMGKAALNNCFLTSIRVDGFDWCKYGIIPIPCVRVRNNWPTAIMEATGKHSHVAVLTIMAESFIQSWRDEQMAAPTAKKKGQDSGAPNSSSGRVMARVLGVPLVVESAMRAIATPVSMGSICQPSSIAVGYHYFAEGDQTKHGVLSLWHRTVSMYYFNKMTSGISFLATGLATTGLCGLDTNFMLCIGGYNTKYPTAADIPAGSPALRVIGGMWRGVEVMAAPAGTYGPYQTSLGSPVHAQLHLPTAMPGGVGRLPTYSPASYMQPLVPGVPGSPTAIPQTWCSVLGVGPGSAPQIFPQTLSEEINKTWSEEEAMAFAYWTRFTCCMWCTVDPEAVAARHLLPEQGILPVLTRKP